MKLIFISNYLTHHQLPFCRELYRRIGHDFLFLATNAMEEERIRMGWGLQLADYPFAAFYDDDSVRFERELLESDVVICGGTHFVYIQKRVEAGKLTFRYFERLYKTGQYKAFYPGSFRRKRLEHTRFQNNPVYLLCAGCYVASDFRLFGAYKDKMYKWGYFPECRKYEPELLWQKKKPGEILWTGRMIDWKHPLEPVKAAVLLRRKGIPFHLTMIGEGPMRDRVLQEIAAHGLTKEITVLDFMKPEKVREYMERSRIYLMTSDRQEGWGAVVNEAMNSGCAVIGSVEAGSVPYLIQNGRNGFIYRQGHLAVLVERLGTLLTDETLTQRIGCAAYQTIAENWNAAKAAERFLQLAGQLQTQNAFFYETDILSKAEPVSIRENRKKCTLRDVEKCR